MSGLGWDEGMGVIWELYNSGVEGWAGKQE